jgi:hypothetical protein
MTALVLKQNLQRSVAIGATDKATGAMVELGNVTIAGSTPIPSVGTPVEVRYLYRHEKGCLFQPTYLGPRTDVAMDTITTMQITRIKLKGQDFDLDDLTVSQQAREELAQAEFAQNLAAPTNYMGSPQETEKIVR